MEIASFHDAESQLSRLIDDALGGEDVIISRDGRPIVRLVPIRPDPPPGQGGQRDGPIRLADDLDALPDDIPSAFDVLGRAGLIGPVQGEPGSPTDLGTNPAYREGFGRD